MTETRLPPAERWSNDFLNSMRQQGDPLADGVIADLFAKGEVDAVNALLDTLVKNDGLPSPLLPQVVRDYLAETAKIPLAHPEQITRARAAGK